MDRNTYVEELIKSYSGCYDIDRYDQTNELPLAARAIFHQRSARYVLMKKAELWNAECNEYLYMYSMPHLTQQLYEQCLQYTVEEGSKLVQPGKGHMYSYVSAVFVADTIERDVLQSVKRCRIHKNFLFSFHGWMDVHTAAVDVSQEKVVVNGAGRDKAKILKRLLQIKQKGGLFK